MTTCMPAPTFSHRTSTSNFHAAPPIYRQATPQTTTRLSRRSSLPFIVKPDHGWYTKKAEPQTIGSDGDSSSEALISKSQGRDAASAKGREERFVGLDDRVEQRQRSKSGGRNVGLSRLSEEQGDGNGDRKGDGSWLSRWFTTSPIVETPTKPPPPPLISANTGLGRPSKECTRPHHSAPKLRINTNVHHQTGIKKCPPSRPPRYTPTPTTPLKPLFQATEAKLSSRPPPASQSLTSGISWETPLRSVYHASAVPSPLCPRRHVSASTFGSDKALPALPALPPVKQAHEQTSASVISSAIYPLSIPKGKKHGSASPPTESLDTKVKVNDEAKDSLKHLHRNAFPLTRWELKSYLYHASTSFSSCSPSSPSALSPQPLKLGISAEINKAIRTAQGIHVRAPARVSVSDGPSAKSNRNNTKVEGKSKEKKEGDRWVYANPDLLFLWEIIGWVSYEKHGEPQNLKIEGWEQLAAEIKPQPCDPQVPEVAGSGGDGGGDGGFRAVNQREKQDLARRHVRKESVSSRAEGKRRELKRRLRHLKLAAAHQRQLQHNQDRNQNEERSGSKQGAEKQRERKQGVREREQISDDVRLDTEAKDESDGDVEERRQTALRVRNSVRARITANAKAKRSRKPSMSSSSSRSRPIRSLRSPLTPFTPSTPYTPLSPAYTLAEEEIEETVEEVMEDEDWIKTLKTSKEVGLLRQREELVELRMEIERLVEVNRGGGICENRSVV